jgi:hypothetical protein
MSCTEGMSHDCNFDRNGNHVTGQTPQRQSPPSMVMIALTWSLKAWFALTIPVAPRCRTGTS